MKFVIGVLALQGCIDLHQKHIEALSASFLKVTTKEHMKQVDAYILPGGESSTMLRLMQKNHLFHDLAADLQTKPVWGICAGAILMARHVKTQEQASFKLLNMDVDRNSYGRQLDSFTTSIDSYDVSFIRAPRIVATKNPIMVKERYNGDPVWVVSGSYMATTFHPELNKQYPSPMHSYFLDIVHRHYKK